MRGALGQGGNCAAHVTGLPSDVDDEVPRVPGGQRLVGDRVRAVRTDESGSLGHLTRLTPRETGHVVPKGYGMGSDRTAEPAGSAKDEDGGHVAQQSTATMPPSRSFARGIENGA